MAESKPRKTMREAEAIELLRSKIGDEGYDVIAQVPDATGARQRRTMDALLVQCWPSRGLSLTACEYKATRSDWRRELRQPEKAENIARYCHYMLVLAPKDVVPVEELPPAWGLWELHKTEKQCRLLRTKAPLPRDDVEPLDLVFMSAVLRARERYNGNAAKLEVSRQRDREAEQRRVNDAVKYRTQDLQRLKDKVVEFEDASGIKIASGWGLDRLGAGVAEFLKDPDQFHDRIKQQRIALARLLETMDAVIGVPDGK